MLFQHPSVPTFLWEIFFCKYHVLHVVSQWSKFCFVSTTDTLVCLIFNWATVTGTLFLILLWVNALLFYDSTFVALLLHAFIASLFNLDRLWSCHSHIDERRLGIYKFDVAGIIFGQGILIFLGEMSRGPKHVKGGLTEIEQRIRDTLTFL